MGRDRVRGLRTPLRAYAAAAVAVAALVAVLAPGTALAGSQTIVPAHLNGDKAVAPKGAPGYVKEMIRAGNKIRHKKYVWGGGHGDWKDKGYDCSGAVSYVLHGAGMIDYALDSEGFMKWGESGRGDWVSIYASKDHVYMVVAGLRFDTSNTGGNGPRWSTSLRSTSGTFAVRHPEGL